MKPHPEYKDRSIEWIGQVPEHWTINQLRRVADVNNSNVNKKSYEDETPVRLCNYTDVYYNEYITDDMELMQSTASESEIDQYTLDEGDVVITKDSEDWDDIGVPACVAEPLTNVLCGYHLTILKGHEGELDGRFLLRALQSSGIMEQLHIAAKGITRYGLSLRHMKRLLLPLPPLPEQRAIAAYLDRKTAQLDTLIAKKQRLIDLLQEQRTAVINRAVTKGLDPDAPMQDSGIEWLGEVPEKWRVVRLKYLIEGSLAYGANESASEENHEHPRYIRITDFDDDGMLRDKTFKSLSPDIANDYLLNDGDILFARSGATVGKTFQFKDYEGDACYAGYLIKASPNEEEILSDFLYLLTKSNAYENWKNSIFIQATIQNISANKYQELEIPVPPVEEQRQIVNHLSNELSGIEEVIAREQLLIERLELLRRSLISEVVTGKIDVRNETLETIEVPA